jgi:hypothetical protein
MELHEDVQKTNIQIITEKHISQKVMEMGQYT